jgi:hypothetical protein
MMSMNSLEGSRRLALTTRLILAAGLTILTGPGNRPAFGQSGGAQEVAPTQEQLLQLVAPIALYPDALVAQILAGSTYPTQIVEAARFLKSNPKMSGDALVNAVNQQSWDPSVKALTQFPSVLDNMNQNLSWTSALGDAYYNVPQEVLNAVQELRWRAQQAGTLKSTSQQTVTADNSTQTIIIQPAQPTVVYVPTYNPATVYGAPVATYPGYTSGEMLATAALSFGVGMLVGAAVSNSSWGWNSWNCNWHGGNVVYNNNVFVSRSNVFAGSRGYWAGYRNVNYNRPPQWAGNAGRGPGWNAGQLNRPSTLPANVNRPAVNRPAVNRPAVNRPGGQQIASKGTAQTRLPSSARKQGFQNYRGFDKTANRGAGAFGGFEPGGSARLAANRGRTSLGGAGRGFQGGGRRAGGLQGGRGGRRR